MWTRSSLSLVCTAWRTECSRAQGTWSPVQMGGCRSTVWQDMPEVKQAVLTLELNFTEMRELKSKGKKKKQRQLQKTERRGWRKGEKDPRGFEFFPFSCLSLSLAWAPGKVSGGRTQDGLTSSPFCYITLLNTSVLPAKPFFLHLSFPLPRQPTTLHMVESLLACMSEWGWSEIQSPHSPVCSWWTCNMSKKTSLYCFKPLRCWGCLLL